MATLDLSVMIVFDATNSSGSSSALGDTTLPASIVEQYSRHLPAATGFLNGYGPASHRRRVSPPRRIVVLLALCWCVCTYGLACDHDTAVTG